ncbi:MAG: right-handed parallel beta-helix repeat-containing protein [Spirochaetales bacterium]|nr:right-handed parallel beta-helix repeat-containing protein [Spirochaetales bacterium]MCF7939741.1 right-handed parallel beta-helix repeat-containing protein [Spirochaetales bacterium]
MPSIIKLRRGIIGAALAGLVLTFFSCGDSEFYLDLERLVEEYEAAQKGIIVYVNGATGDDVQNSGLEPDNPLATIQAGINAAEGRTGSEVRVAEGTYSINETITMANGVSLYGGYSSDFSSRDADSHTVTIDDGRSETTGFSTIAFPSEVSTVTVFDGFSVQGGVSSGDIAEVVSCNGSDGVVIRNNDISAGGSYDIFGVYVGGNGSTLIEKNTIEVTNGDSNCRGMYVNGSGSISITVRNNVISATDGNFTTGIAFWPDSGTPVIHNNTFYVGQDNGNYSDCIRISDNTNPRIENNIFYMTAGVSGVRRIIREEEVDSDPAIVRNNCFYNYTIIYADYDGTNPITINDVNDPTMTTQNGAGTSEGNVDHDPGFTNPFAADFHLDHPPVNVSGGGRDLSSYFTADLEGTVRTTETPSGATNTGASGWSMGAYEYVP